MGHSRRDTLLLGLASAGGLAVSGRAVSAAVPGAGDACTTTKAGSRGPAWRAGIEGQRRADLGDGHYLNPVLAGDRPDPNILKDGADYYATFSSFLHYPAVVIWHSRDLINWMPIGPALETPLGSVWALDIVKHDGRYFIYIPIFNPDAPWAKVMTGIPTKTYVIHAADMRGPWSDPIDMHIDGIIDPGHAVGEDGRRYLFLNGGQRVRISDDGLRRDGPVEQVYRGWDIPDDWVIEAMALEGPKVLRHDGYFYLFSGQGGTAGPPTSHMVIVARSKSIDGPWENCPHNPIVHTESADEPWWSRGHATPVQGPAGDWWLSYHGYENGFRSLGREMLLDPFEWTADGWPKPLGGDLSRPLRKPLPGSAASPGLALSDDFHADMFGSRLTFFAPKPGYRERATLAGGALTLAAQGTGPGNASPLALIAGDRAYEVTVDIALDGGEAGLLLFYDDTLFCGIGADAKGLRAYKGGQEASYPPPGPGVGDRMSLRVVNDRNVASFFIGRDRTAMRKIISFEVAGYNHNMAGGFLSLRPAIFATGGGQAVFRSLSYRALGNA